MMDEHGVQGIASQSTYVVQSICFEPAIQGLLADGKAEQGPAFKGQALTNWAAGKNFDT